MDMPVSRTIPASHTDSKPLATWAAVASVGIGAFALVTTEFLPVGLLPMIAADLGISEGTAGLMVTTPGFLAAITAPMTLGFAARFDRKHVLVALLMLLAFSNAIVATAQGFTALMVGRVLLGIAVGGFWTIGGSLGPRLRPGAEGPRATALIFSGVSLGTVAGVPAGSLIGDLFGWRTAFLLVSGGWSRALTMSFKQFAKNFANDLPGAEQQKAFDDHIVPAPGRIYYQSVLGLGASIDWKKADRAPLLLVSGMDDRTVEPGMVQQNLRRYSASSAITDCASFSGRSHFLIASPGWEEIADELLAWVEAQIR